MQLPATAPKSLQFASKAETDEALFKLLVKEPPHLIKMVASAVQDELWAVSHVQFMEISLDWITQQFFQDKLLMPIAQKLANVLRKHYALISQFLPRNLTLKLEDRELSFNSLLLSSGSEVLREIVRRECRDKRKTSLNMGTISYSIFEVIEEFLTTGTYLELVRKDKKQIIKILKLAMEWDLEELSKGCQEHLIGYVDKENVFKTLLKAHEKKRVYLRAGCFDFLNRLNHGYRMEGKDAEELGFEFIDFNENSLDAFNLVKDFVTTLIARKKVSEDPQFASILKECPHLKGLTLSESVSLADTLDEIPKTLQELDLSLCDWLTSSTLDKMVHLCPNLTHLTLISDTKIDFDGWAHLKKLPLLRALNLTRCSQIGDNELSAILQSTPELVILNLEECKGISDHGFYELPNLNKNFIALNFSRTEISDQPLIELALKCDSLSLLNVTRCEKLTSVGIAEVARHAKLLKEFIITLCDVSKQTLASIKQSRPFLKIIN